MALAAVGMFLIAYQWGNQYQYGGGEPPAIGGVLLRPAVPLPRFQLVDSSGRRFDEEAMRDHWTLLSIGSVVSARGHRTVGRMGEIYNLVGDRRDLRGKLRLWLISADSAPALARDFERLSPGLSVLSAERAEVAALAQALGADSDQALGADSDQALGGDSDQALGAGAADASGLASNQRQPALPTLFLIDPDTRLSALFPGAQAAESIADDLEALARHHAVHGDRHSTADDDGR
jgi:hypothetical protein